MFNVFLKKKKRRNKSEEEEKTRIKIIMIDLYVEKDILHKNPAF